MIILPMAINVALESWCATAGSREISGLGTVQADGSDIVVKRVFLLNVGSGTETELGPSEIIQLLTRHPEIEPSDLKLWFHRHPIGNGIPGEHNWSGTDEATIQLAPLGSPPEIVEWSVSIVRTPMGWVGRLDDHTSRLTYHLEVKQAVPRSAHESILRMVRAATSVKIPVIRQEQSGTRVAAPRRKAKVHRSQIRIPKQDLRDIRLLLSIGMSPEYVAAKMSTTLEALRENGLISHTDYHDSVTRSDDMEYIV